MPWNSLWGEIFTTEYWWSIREQQQEEKEKKQKKIGENSRDCSCIVVVVFIIIIVIAIMNSTIIIVIISIIFFWRVSKMNTWTTIGLCTFLHLGSIFNFAILFVILSFSSTTQFLVKIVGVQIKKKGQFTHKVNIDNYETWVTFPFPGQAPSSHLTNTPVCRSGIELTSPGQPRGVR